MAQDVSFTFLYILQSRWPSMWRWAKEARWVLKLDEKWKHQFWFAKWCHSFRQNCSTHLPTNIKVSESLLVRHPTILTVYSLCLNLLSTQAGVSFLLHDAAHYMLQLNVGIYFIVAQFVSHYWNAKYVPKPIIILSIQRCHIKAAWHMI